MTYIKQAIPHASVKFQNINGSYLFIVYLNTTVLKSDIGNSLINDDYYKYADFACVYSINDKQNSTSFSLRSGDRNYPCCEVAKIIGGGGHRNASGASLGTVTNCLPFTVLDNGHLYNSLKTVYQDSITVKDNNLNIVYATADYRRYEMAKFLLQTKYILPETHENVQECSDIFIKRDDEKNKTYHVAAVYRYNPIENMTSFVLTFSNLPIEMVNEVKSIFGVAEGENKIDYLGSIFKLLPRV